MGAEKKTLLDELSDEERQIWFAAMRVPVSPEHAAKLLKMKRWKWCLEGMRLMLEDLEKKNLLKRVSMQGKEYWVAHDGAADPKNFCREPDAPTELVIAMCVKVVQEADRRVEGEKKKKLYLRLYPSQVQEVKQKEKVDEDEADKLCRQITPFDLISELLGRDFNSTVCRELLMEKPKQWAEMVELAIKKAIEMGIPPSDTRSKKALRSWKKYLNIS